MNLPRELEMLEAQVRDAINRIARGRVTARIGSTPRTASRRSQVRFNVPLAKA